MRKASHRGSKCCKFSKALRNLRFDWTQDPEVVLSERLKTIGLESEHLKIDPELFGGLQKVISRSRSRIPPAVRPCCICSL